MTKPIYKKIKALEIIINNNIFKAGDIQNGCLAGGTNCSK